MEKEKFVVAIYDGVCDCFVGEKTFSIQEAAEEYRHKVMEYSGAPEYFVKVFTEAEYKAQYKPLQ